MRGKRDGAASPRDAAKATAREASAAGVWVVLARAYRAIEQYVERSVAALGMGLSDFMILEALLHKGPMTMSEVCEAVLLKAASMTAAVDRLEAKGYVARGFDGGDRRVRRVSLTAAGTVVIRELYAQHERDLEALMAGVPVSERVELRRGLKAIGLAAQAKV